MEDCYTILGVTPAASAAEIKTAFRRKAKLLHPDTADGDSPDVEAFQKLLSAYETLLTLHRNGGQNEPFTRFYGESKREKPFDYREWLVSRTDEESRCKLIFFDLMHRREDDAVAEYKRISVSRADFSLSYWFTREDFMDCGFILAEELVFRGDFYDAYLLLAKVIRMEYSYSYFRHFFPEVMDLTRNVLRNKLAHNVDDELCLDAWEDAFDLGFSSKDEAYFLRLMSEAYDRLGDTATARTCLKKAFELDPQLSVPQRYKRRYV